MFGRVLVYLSKEWSSLVMGVVMCGVVRSSTWYRVGLWCTRHCTGGIVLFVDVMVMVRVVLFGKVMVS